MCNHCIIPGSRRIKGRHQCEAERAQIRHLKMTYHARQEGEPVNPLMIPTLFICSCIQGHIQTAKVTKDVSREGSTEDRLGTLEVRKFLTHIPSSVLASLLTYNPLYPF